jgi:hypothetical protein
MMMHDFSRRFAALALLLSVPLCIPAEASAQAAPPEVVEKMARFAKARQFYDAEVLATLHTPAFVAAVKDSLLARYKRYKDTYPVTRINEDDGGIQGIVHTLYPKPLYVHFRLYTRAFQHVADSQPEKGAIELLAFLDAFPIRPTVVLTSNHTLGSVEPDRVKFYLSETLKDPILKEPMETRLVAEWIRVQGKWYLNSIE